MILSGLQKLTLLDFPGRIAATVFTRGCNMRCPFCHNASLVVGGADIIPEDEFFAFLESRRGRLGGVCVSGGEPTLQADLPRFIEKIKAMDFEVKLDTNGTNPDMLSSLIDGGLLDYVAMDIKSSPEGYARVSGVSPDMEKIKRSIELLLSDKIDYEFRTTVAKPLFSTGDFVEIGKLIKGAKRYYLQGFLDSGDLIGEGL
ncbi:MAG: anaerobic ribonucleoside-triphosphate reductase activating protein, partial [Clostridia bacterium]|nr:anaerobic ribonucleoside-triphosphate reductase activating protein [Clostridia bacterium]